MSLLFRLLLSVCMVAFTTPVIADMDAPFSEPYHQHGRGRIPSIFWSTGRNLGSFFVPNEEGRIFKELQDHEWDKETHGLVYFYRPNSQWASEELEAPSYYINSELVFNLRGGSYTYVLLPAGSYDLSARKSLMPLFGFEGFDDKFIIGFDLRLLASFGLEVDPGSITYIRHSEVSLPSKIHPGIPPDHEMRSAHVQLVEREVAMGEMPKTRYLEPSFWFATDTEQIEELLDGTMQDYGWWSILWPWSNNFMFGFPIFYVPSDMYRELRPDKDLTIEQRLYLYKDDVDEYLAQIEEMRRPKRDFLAPWRKPKTKLPLKDELLLEKLEREARAGNIRPVKMEEEEIVLDDDERWWDFLRFFYGQDPVEQFPVEPKYLSETRKSELERIKLTLN